MCVSDRSHLVSFSSLLCKPFIIKCVHGSHIGGAKQ